MGERMASGFFGGLLQGVAMGAIALAALSLAAPQPRSAAPAEFVSAETPAARTMDMPIGSEFGRGSDAPPQVNAPAPAMARPIAAPAAPQAARAETVPALASDPVVPVTPRPIPAASDVSRQAATAERTPSSPAALRPTLTPAADLPLRPALIEAPAQAAAQDSAPDLSMIDAAVDAAPIAENPSMPPAPAQVPRPAVEAPALNLPIIDFSGPPVSQGN